MRSLTQARGWSSILNAFKGEDDQPIAPREFIPFPDDFELESRKISHETERILSRLIRDHKLSPKATALAIQDTPRLKDSL